MAQTHVVLKDSKRPAARTANRVRDVLPSSPVTVTITLRGPKLPDPGEPISRTDFERSFAASSSDVETVKKALERFGLKAEQESALTRSLVVTGTASQIEEAFQPRLGIYRSDRQGEFRGREGEVKIPAELDGLVTGVFGLDERRVAERKAGGSRPSERSTKPLGPADLEKRYRFPAADIVDQTIAIAEFGGGYFPEDLAAWCDRQGRRVPQVTTVPLGREPLTRTAINGLAASQKEEALGESHEVMMDVQIVAGLCPGAHIILYFASFDQKGWIDLLNAVITGHPASPVVLSVSWGLAEDGPGWSGAARNAINERMQAASVLGITVCAASGDDGAGDHVRDGRAHVHFPASSPFVLAVGGTMLEGEDEVVWWEDPGELTAAGGGSTGGGVSVLFDRPRWQTVAVASLNHPASDGRIVPDVAALAGPPLYDLVFEGKPLANGGTSAAAPLWASLIARIVSLRGRHMFLTPLLYQPGRTGQKRGESAFVDITHGNNKSPQPDRGYAATDGFDAVTGWGVPDGQALLDSL